MATGSSINAKVAYGYAKAGGVLGFPYQWYRPSLGTAPIGPGNLLGSVTPYITADPSLKSGVPPSDTKPVWFAAFDTTDTLPGDYLVGPAGTFFIGTQFMPSVPSLIFCNAVFTVTRDAGSAPSPQARFGAAVNPATLAQSFPGWLKSAERRTNPELQEPGDVPLPSADIMLPVSLTTEIIRGDTLTTAGTTPATYNVQSADLLVASWVITALQAGG